MVERPSTEIAAGMSKSHRHSIDEAPFQSFHRRLTLYSCGGPFCDGYILGIIAIALAPLAVDIGLTEPWKGLIAAASLVGMILGGSVFGFLTDLVGRQVMYTIDLMVFVIASAAQYWVHDPWTLFVLRFVLGLAVGADYPIACALMVEFAPRRSRGAALSAMIGAWWLGYTVSFVAGYVLAHFGVSWRWMLASSAVPAGIVALLRLGTPESPRWLVAKGRSSEAQALVKKHLGDDYALEETPASKTRYGSIFERPYGRRTLFVCLFWSCQVIPVFGIYTFAPDLLRALGMQDPNLGTAIVSLFFLAGVIPTLFLVDRVGRRPLLIIPFAVTAITLVVLSFAPKHSSILITACFVVFAAFNAGSSVVAWVYPSELFPTDIRATALGFTTAISRVGAAVCTFLVPYALQRLGVGGLMQLFAGICAIGWAVSMRMAPETRGLSLAEASG
jgi:putative MFS transporter